MRSPILIAALLLSLATPQAAKAEPLFLVAAGITAAVGGTVMYDRMTPKSQHCYWPTPRQRVCKIVKDAELEQRIAEAWALERTDVQQRLASGQEIPR